MLLRSKHVTVSKIISICIQVYKQCLNLGIPFGYYLHFEKRNFVYTANSKGIPYKITI